MNADWFFWNKGKRVTNRSGCSVKQTFLGDECVMKPWERLCGRLHCSSWTVAHEWVHKSERGSVLFFTVNCNLSQFFSLNCFCRCDLNGNKTLCHPILSVIIVVIKQSRLLLHCTLYMDAWFCLITSIILQTGMDHYHSWYTNWFKVAIPGHNNFVQQYPFFHKTGLFVRLLSMPIGPLNF